MSWVGIALGIILIIVALVVMWRSGEGDWPNG